MLSISNSPIRSRLQFAPRTLTLGNTTRFSTRQRTQPFSMSTKTDITLYTAGTPNGIKVPILLAELGLEYKVRGDRAL